MTKKMFIQSYRVFFILIAAAFIFSACSTEFSIDNGTFQFISFTANPVYVKKGKTRILTAVVENPLNDVLTYSYQVVSGDGSITGTGSTVTYSVTNMITNAEVMLTVTDTKGVSISNTITIPVIEPFQKISDTAGNFTGTLDDGDFFSCSVASIGDLNGDGVSDIAVGTHRDNDGGPYRGAVWILFLNSDGTVKSHQKISSTEGDFTGTLDDNDSFGYSIANIGDLNGDGITDIAVGAYMDGDGGPYRGAVWILFLNSDGTVKNHQKISDTQGNFTGTLDMYDFFGNSIANIGDLNGDGVSDIAVGAYFDYDGGPYHGAVWILFLNTDGTVKSHQKISSAEGNFTGTLNTYDFFGYSVASMGDLNGDGISDIAVGGGIYVNPGNDKGAVWILFMNTNGTVKSHQKISDTEGGFTGTEDVNDHFGYSVANIGDLNSDGVSDIAVGAYGDDDGGNARGTVWILFLNSDGTVKSHQKISDTQGNFTGTLDDGDYFGYAVANIGDLNGDGVTDIAVGAIYDDDGGTNRGSVWILFMNADGTVGN